MRPFPECRLVQGHFGDACGNCKWRDHAARCRFPIVIDLDSSESSSDNDDDEDEDVKPAVRQHPNLSRAIEGLGVAADHPIVVE